MKTEHTAKPFHRILLTGAGGGLGRMLRDRLNAWADVVRLSDINVDGLGAARDGEEIVQCDLADKAAVMAMVKGADVVLHFGGLSTEFAFEDIMYANILGTANLYEAVHKCGIKRVVFASSNHAVGFYRTTDVIDADAPTRPDTFYGVSKCFGEALSRYYYDRLGVETVCVRIGSSFPEPLNRRMMTTYLSYDDLVELLRCALFATRVGHCIVFGQSNNSGSWWVNTKAAHLGFQARDSSSKFAHLFPLTGDYPPAADLATTYQGGAFILNGPQYK